MLGVRWYGKGCHLHTEIKGKKLKTKVLNRVIKDLVTYNKMWCSKSAFAITTEEHDNYYASSEYPLFKPDFSKLNICFLKYLMLTDSFYDEAKKRLKGTTSRARLNPKDFLAIPIRVPSVNEQRKIADILSSVDATIESTQKVIEQTKKVKQGLLQKLLTKGIGHTKFKKTEIGEIPEEWNFVSLMNSLELLKDGTHLPPKRTTSGPLLLSVRNMINDSLSLLADDTHVPWEFLETMHKNWKIKPGDVLLAVVGATIGKTAIVPNDLPPFTLQRSVAVLRGKPEILNNSFLKYYLDSTLFLHQMWQRANQTAQPGIYLAEIGKIKIGLPPYGQQLNIVNILDSSQNSFIQLEKELMQLKELKKGLMQDLLTGTTRVKV